MEAENRFTAAGLNQQLSDVRSFSFFQLNSLLRRYASLYNSMHDDQFVVRYRAKPSLGFPASDVDGCEQHGTDFQQFLDVTVTFMGLYGPASPLPAFYTERIIQSSETNNPSRDLMDMFNHRFIDLLQNCWEKYRYFSQYRSGGEDQYSRWLLSMLGVQPELLQQAGCLRWQRILPFAGILLGNVCSGDLLCKIIRAYFGLTDVLVQPWVKRQIQVADDQTNRIGQRNVELGQDCVLGDSLEDCSGKFALHIGQLTPAQYRGFLPDGAVFSELVQLVRFALKDPLDFDLHLRVADGASEAMQLDDSNGRLGWNCFLGEAPPGEGPHGNAKTETVICIEDFPSI